MMPIMYTPTVGHAIQNYCELIDDDKGYFITYRPASVYCIDDHEVLDFHMSYMEPIFQKAIPYGTEKRILICTDAEAILGIGDQGYGGIEICFGKGKVDTLGAGVNPNWITQIMLDVGTNN